MKPEIKYVENFADSGHNGPAWICLIDFSKTGRTVYFKEIILKRINNGGLVGNHAHEETGEEYWVSGPKKNGQDRHRFGSGPVEIDPEIADE
jgi:hypothetical protein